MLFSKSSSSALVLLAVFIQIVQAGPGGYVTLVNLTPYDWKLSYQHSYQMDWKPAPLITSGSISEQYAEYWYHWGSNGDCAAEAVYSLEGSKTGASFTLQARQTNGKKFQIKYNNGLASLNNPENSLIELGWVQDGSVLFLLSGDGEQPYVSSNPPVGWMQSTLPTIGFKTLREIAMPASHDSGMSEITRHYGGVYHNTATQSQNVYNQLKFGARWFDIRPVHRYGTWYTGHFSPNAVLGQAGAMGRTIENIVKDINTFNAENPGELIVLDITHEMECASSWVLSLSADLWGKLFDLLGTIKDVYILPSDAPEDLSTWPISNFIQPGSKSAVLIRIPGGVAPPSASSNQTGKAIVPDFRLPVVGSYSNTNDPNFLSKDQLAKLSDFRTSRDTPMLKSVWTITQGFWHIIDVANWYSSLIADAIPAYKKMYKEIWTGISRDKYPNLVEVDDVHDTGVTALCMGINERFAKAGAVGNSRMPSKRLLKRGVNVI